MRNPFQVARPAAADRITELIERFPYYVEAFDKNPPFTGEQLQSHKETLFLRSQFATAQEAARDPRFAQALRSTLLKWGIGGRGSNLVGPEEFVATLRNVAESLSTLEGKKIGESLAGSTRTLAEIWRVIEGLKIVRNENRVVACTKALHHLLPDLIPPMDREYTQTFFAWANPQFQYHPKECFQFAFEAFVRITEAVKRAQYVGGGWRTSMTKVLDNALVGYCRSHGLKSSGRKQRERDKALIRKARELGLL